MTENKTKYTPTEALKLLRDVSKNSLYNDMNNGVITYTTEKWGKKERRYIDGSELTRAYGEKFFPSGQPETSAKNKTGQPETLQKQSKSSSENNLMQDVVEILREELEKKDKIIEDLSKKLDNAYDTVNRQTLLIEDKRENKPVERKKGFWYTFLGKTD